MTAYKRLLRGLLDAGVSLLVVGGYAAIAHGLTRATDDLDIWIEPTLDNARKTLQVLQALGTPTEGWTAESITDPYTFVRVGEDEGRKVDIMASAGGALPFYKAWPNRFETDFFGLSVPFIGLRDLIRIKCGIGRHKDLADVESLRRFHRLVDDTDQQTADIVSSLLAFEVKTWPGGWIGAQTEHKGIRLTVAMLPGKKVTRGMLDDLCAQLSGVERKGWKVKRTCKAKQGWFWFNIARGAQGEQRAYALYGKGRRGMYAMLLLTDPAGARKHRGAIALGEGRQVAPAARSSGEGGEEALNG